MILRTTLILSALAIGVSGASAKVASTKGSSAKAVFEKGASGKVESAQVPHFTHSGGRHSDSHRHLQRWNNMYPGAARHSGANDSRGYVRNSGPRFHGPHRDW